jgi:hypothetical protein
MGFNQNLRFQKVEGLNDGFEGGEIQNEARERERRREKVRERAGGDDDGDESLYTHAICFWCFLYHV